MSINNKLTWVNTMLQSPFPHVSEASVTRADLGVWQAALSRVEARMMFIGALSPSILKQGMLSQSLLIWACMNQLMPLSRHV